MSTFDPRPWTPPKAPPLAGRFAPNDRLAAADLWDLGGVGPEDVAVAADGTVFTGLEDGRILRIPAGGGPPAEIADTGGRPLGIEIDPEGRLVVCDAARGLFRVGLDGTTELLADGYEGQRFLLTNNAAVASDGTIYFTDSSRRYPLGAYVDDLLEHSGTGRLFARHPDGSLELLADGLQFANGVALDTDERNVYVAETGAYRVNRIHLEPEDRGRREVFVENLPGFPDNLSFDDGTLWVPLASPRQPLVDLMLPRPWLRRLSHRLPSSLKPKPVRHGIVLGFRPDGSLRYNLQDAGGKVAVTTGARWHEGRLFVGSLTASTLAVLDLGHVPTAET